MTNIDLRPDTEESYRRMAFTLAIPYEAYLSRILEAGTGVPSSFSSATVPSISFDHELDAFSEKLPVLPTLPPNFSRADMYLDRD